MVNMLLALNECKKPIVAVVRGGSIGIGYTLLSHCTFVYVSPETTFKSIFMQSGQTPEGTSTLMFPKLYGQRKANEILLLDKTMTAQEAVHYGFANAIIDKFDPKKDWFDPSLIPAIPKLLETDYDTLLNGMNVINKAFDNKKIEEITRYEAASSFNKWQQPNSLPLMM